MPINVLKRELSKAKFADIVSGSEALNVNGALVPGDILDIWEGETSLWTLSGNGTSTTAAAKNGTYGLDSGTRSTNDETILSNGSDIDIHGTYESLRFWVKPVEMPLGERLRVRWRTNAGVNNGIDLRVSDYLPDMDLDVWQQVTIPISDFGLTANVGKLILIYAVKQGQRFYYDDFELLEPGTGGTRTFRIVAPEGEHWHVSMSNLILSAGNTGWNSNAFANISGGLPLGLIFRRKILSTGEVVWSQTFQKNIELFGQLTPVYDFAFSDDELMVKFLMGITEEYLVVTDDDVLEFLVRDDLSSLTNMRAYVDYGKEVL